MMSTFPLGRVGVRRSGYGAMQLVGPFAFGTLADRPSAIGVLRAAVAAGVDHIDTAQYYGPGVVNDLIREALYPYPDGLAIVSRVAVRRDGSGAVLTFDDPDQLREGIADNLRSLRVGQLAAVNLRTPPGRTGQTGLVSRARKGTGAMTQITIHPWAGVVARASAWVRRRQGDLSDRVHAAADERARRYGWEVTWSTGRFGFGARTYRDPRFRRPAPAALPWGSPAHWPRSLRSHSRGEPSRPRPGRGAVHFAGKGRPR